MGRKSWLAFFFIVNSLFLQVIDSQAAVVNSAALDTSYLGFIHQKVNSCFIYPQEAKAKGWEGIVKVIFTVTRDGKIKNIDIAESSGYPLLDASAILAIKDASPYPFPADYKTDTLQIVLPVKFSQEQHPNLLPYQEIQEEPLPKAQAAQLPLPLKFPEGLNSFIEIALRNNQPTKVAQEEIALSKLKVWEAGRNLLPSVKVSAYNTEGEVYKIDYEERETKLEVTQPLFYGGRLLDAMKQAKVNLEINQKNYDRLKLDITQKTETAYYNLLAIMTDLELKEQLLQEAKSTLDKVEKIYQSGMAIPLEINSARSWYKQLALKLDTTKQDFFMAELTLKQVLNLNQLPPIKPQDWQEVKKLDLDLNTCLERAFQYRPEIYLSELMIKFSDYGQKIKAKEKSSFTVDLVSGYGDYQGHYKTEPWTDSNNWYTGVKVSKPWIGNTINTSYSKEETQPRFGQTSPTGSATLNVELNLFDNLKLISEKKSADIDLLGAMGDLEETIKTITFEVQEAFLNYQKSFLQLSTAKTEMDYRKNEMEVVKIRAQVGETALSSVMETLYSFAEAQEKHIRALYNYHISLANLKKTTGYGI